MGNLSPKNINTLMKLDLEQPTIINSSQYIKIGTENRHKENEGISFIFTSQNFDAKGLASPKDDLESLSYLLVYFLNEGLPWENTQWEDSDSEIETIFKLKSSCTNNELWYGLPPEILMFHRYIKSLHHNTTPNYEKLILILQNKLELHVFKKELIKPKRLSLIKMLEDNDSILSKSKISSNSNNSFTPIRYNRFGHWTHNYLKDPHSINKNHKCYDRHKSQNIHKRNMYQGRKNSIHSKKQVKTVDKWVSQWIGPKELICSGIYKVGSKVTK